MCHGKDQDLIKEKLHEKHCVIPLILLSFDFLFFLGGKDAVSSGFGYFMSAAIVLSLCLASYIMLHKLVSSRLFCGPCFTSLSSHCDPHKFNSCVSCTCICIH